MSMWAIVRSIGRSPTSSVAIVRMHAPRCQHGERLRRLPESEYWYDIQWSGEPPDRPVSRIPSPTRSGTGVSSADAPRRRVLVAELPGGGWTLPTPRSDAQDVAQVNAGTLVFPEEPRLSPSDVRAICALSETVSALRAALRCGRVASTYRPLRTRPTWLRAELPPAPRCQARSRRLPPPSRTASEAELNPPWPELRGSR